MADIFDAYHQWLGVKPKDQPPHHYRLLAIEVFEDDPNVIENAADQRMSHVRNFQSGPHGADSQKILNEISAAKVCLLNAGKKSEYDKALRAQLKTDEPQRNERQTRSVRGGAVLPKAQPVASPDVVSQKPEAQPDLPNVALKEDDSAGRRRLSRRKRSLWQSPAVIGVGVLTLGLLIAIGVMLGAGGVQPDEDISAKRDGIDTPASDQRPPSDPELWRKADDSSTQENLDPPNAPLSSVTPEDPPLTDPLTVATTNPPAKQIVDPPQPPKDPQPTPPGRSAVPAEEDREQALAAIKQRFAEQYEEAQEPDTLAALAEQLVKQADAAADDATVRYMLLNEGRRLFIEGFAVDRALDVVQKIATDYDVSRWALTGAAIAALGEAAGNKKQRMQLVETSQAVAEEAFQDAAFAEAMQMLEVAAALAQRSREYQVARAARDRGKEIGKRQELHTAAQQARQTLAADNADADAHGALGAYLCFIEENWEQGLPHLAQGSDAQLAQLAELDVASPTGGAELLTLADGWWDWAKGSKEHRQAALARSYRWYIRALPRLAGLDQTHASKRVDELSAVVVRKDNQLSPPLPWTEGPLGELRRCSGPAGRSYDVAVTLDGRYAITATIDKRAIVWDLAGGAMVRQWEIPHEGVSLTVTRDGRQVLISMKESLLILYEIKTGSEVGRFSPGRGTVTGAAISPDGSLVASGTQYNDQVLRISDMHTQQVVRTLSSREGNVHSVAFSPDGTLLAAACWEGVRLFDMETGVEFRRMEGHQRKVLDVAFSPDGKLLVSSGEDNSSRVWEVATGKELHHCKASYQVAVDFTPDGRRFVTVGLTGGLFVWETATGRLIQRLNIPDNSGYRGAAVTPDGRAVVTVITGGVVVLWRLPD